MKTQNKFYVLISILVVTLLFASGANATGPDYSSLTSAVDFAAAGTAVLAVYAGLAGLGVLVMGGSLIVRKVFSGGR